MIVLVSVFDEEEDEGDVEVSFEGVFANEDECRQALPVLLDGVKVDGDEDEDPVKFDPKKHHVEFEPVDGEIEVSVGAAPTEQRQVVIDFGDDAPDGESVETGFYILQFDLH
jgi:hypothetical protein